MAKARIPTQISRQLVTKEDKEEYEKLYNSCKWIREKLSQVLTKELECAIMESERAELYHSANFVLQQCDRIGYRRGLRRALSLLNLDQEDSQYD